MSATDEILARERCLEQAELGCDPAFFAKSRVVEAQRPGELQGHL